MTVMFGGGKDWVALVCIVVHSYHFVPCLTEKLLERLRCVVGDVDVQFSHCQDRKSTRLNSSHVSISYAVFCLNKNSNPLVTGKCFFKFWTLRSGVSAIRLAASSNLRCDPLPQRKSADTRFHSGTRYRHSAPQT